MERGNDDHRVNEKNLLGAKIYFGEGKLLNVPEVEVFPPYDIVLVQCCSLRAGAHGC